MRFWRVMLIAVALATSVTGIAGAESAGKQTVTFSWDGRFFVDDLPNGKEFLIVIELPKGQKFKQATVWRTDRKQCAEPAQRSRRMAFATDGNKVTINAPALRFAKAYCFSFSASKGMSKDKIDAIEGALTALIASISERGLYDRAARKRFLTERLGPIAEETVESDDEGAVQTVLDWVTSWIEDEQTFVRLWQLHGDRAKAQRRVANLANSLQKMQLSDVPSLYPGDVPSELAAAVATAKVGENLIKASGLTRVGQSHVTAGEPPILAPPAKQLQEMARTLESQARRARAVLCDSRAKPSGSRTELSRQIARLQRELAVAEAALAAVSDADARKAVGKQAQRRVADTRKELRERRMDRLCKDLRSLEAYGERIDGALGGELAAAVAIAQLEAEVELMIGRKTSAIPVEVVLGAQSATPTFTERANFYISADVGVVLPRFSGGNWGAATFVGMNFYFAPVDKDVPLREDGGLGKRISVVAGLTVSGFKDNVDSVSGIAGNSAAVVGTGIRVTDYLRLGTGLVLFRQKHPNPAIDAQDLRAAPYLSLSVDADIAGVIQSLYTKAKPNAAL